MINTTLAGLSLMLRWLWEEEQGIPLRKAQREAARVASSPLSGLGAITATPDSRTTGLSDDDAANARALLAICNSHCLQLEMATSIDRIRIINGKLERPPLFSHDEYASELRVLRETINFELRGAFCYYYPRAKADVLRKIDDDWKLSRVKFQSARRDIDAAVDCYAGGQNTACVFHLMRVAEYGLRALARERRVKFAKPRPLEWATWEAILQQLAVEIKKVANRKPGTARTKALEFYQGAFGEFGAFKDVYRNEVMHARSHYDEHQAMSVMLHVREFMERLATRIGDDAKGAISWGRNS